MPEREDRFTNKNAENSREKVKISILEGVMCDSTIIQMRKPTTMALKRLNLDGL